MYIVYLVAAGYERPLTPGYTSLEEAQARQQQEEESQQSIRVDQQITPCVSTPHFVIRDLNGHLVTKGSTYVETSA